MKKLLLLTLLLANAGWAMATTWKIGPNGNFADINAAMSSASVNDGDVLRIMDNAVIGSAAVSQTVTKSVAIEGPGVVRDANGNITTTATIASSLYLQESGIVVSRLQLTGNVYVRADAVTIEKCYIRAEINGAQQNYDTEDFMLRQCYLENASIRGLNSEDHPGWKIMNNIFVSSATNSSLSFVLSSMYDAVIDHNVFNLLYTTGYSTDYVIKFVEKCSITNNIITKFAAGSGNTVSAVSDKILRDDLFSSNTIAGNVFTGTMTHAGNKGGISTFTDVYTWTRPAALNYPEAQYMLSTGSAARGYATDGGDCGPWDGEYPYLLGGQLKPTEVPEPEFQVEANDLLALKNMYNAFGGDKWTVKKWSFASNGKSREDFPGVTFSDDGRVTAIDLQGNGLAGEMFAIYSPSFEKLTTLNLSRNALTGDVGLLVGNLGKLQTLNLAYNGLSGLSAPLPQTCTNVDLQYQNRVYGNADYLTDNFHKEKPVTVIVNTQTDVYQTLPSLYTYYRPMRRGIYGTDGPSPMIGMLNDTSNGKVRLTLNSGYTIYTYPQDTKLAVIQEEGQTRHSAYPVVLHYIEGDADMNGTANVLDVQYTLTYILAQNTVKAFNYSAANTYADNLINVQDIVSTVNIILAATPAASRSDATGASEPLGATEGLSEGTVFSRFGQLLLSASRPVAAIDVELQGVTTDEVGLMLPSADFQLIGRNTEWGSRYIIFSPTGKSIGADTETPLLRLADSAQPVSIMCADTEAKSVAVAVSTTPTGIAVTESKSVKTDNEVYDLQGRRVEGRSKGLYIVNGRKVIY